MKYLTLLSCFTLLVFIASASSEIKTLSADSLQSLLNNGTNYDFLLIDVRETSELTGGVIATENCHPYNLPYTMQVLYDNISKLPKTAVIILYCQSGVRSGKAESLLEDSGFTSAYSLVGGFSNWKGPTKASSDLKPLVDLPAPSMIHTSAVLMRNASFHSSRMYCYLRNGWLNVNEPLQTPHTLQLYDLEGKCFFNAADPFALQTGFKIPAWFPSETIIARLQSKSIIEYLVLKRL
jgi:rhodanese-related sulfurtransferase